MGRACEKKNTIPSTDLITNHDTQVILLHM